MRKRWLLAASFLIFIVLAGCSKEPMPQDQFSQYIKHWNNQEFTDMYRLLSAKAKESISEDDFVDRYEKVYNDLQISDIEVTSNADKEQEFEEESAALPFSASMNSAAGKIEFTHDATLIKEEHEDGENWFVEWDTTLIFPELGANDKINYASIPAQRGDIIDRTGDMLAFNGTLYEIGIVPEEMGNDEETTIKGLSQSLGISEESIENALNADWVQPGHFVPIKRVSPDNEGLLNEVFSLPGVLKQDVKGRVYPAGESAAHLIGYVGPITAEELEKNEDKGYSSTDLIGKRGLEQVLETQLKGTNGIKISITKEDGSEAVLAEKPVENGEKIQLTIDLTVQEDLYEELKGNAGTASAIDPVTGATMALVSSPSFDPNAASLGLTVQEWKTLEENEQQPLLNRFSHNYVPGSVMKPITGAIGLEEGITTADETKDIKGLRWQKDTSWGSYRVTRVKDPGSPVNFDQAMMYSDNIYFAQEALQLGKDSFMEGLKAFGFEEEIPYVYPLQSSHTGNMDTEIKLADSGYGQGEVEMNILHLAASYTPFINKGSLIKPVLLENEEKNQVWKENIISEETVAIMNSALRKVIQEPGGTGRAAKMDDYPLAGKTGTAELKLNVGMKGQENGMFVAYNPDSPKLLIAMMIESVEDAGGSGIVVEKVKNVFEKNMERF
ncbi:penicillin-binding transpeptidase domain-containing protein [Cytobacillus gottheilii]|uniref:serine-type D-Ala-D-Ala carboxypeptidase n=1 Tax=Cytobacillus gottheilii TaxID=859144 RepID=A0ABX8FAF2_9BACI|nr:penicillin-binding transpeptidase domain-containing protein [Cytobacillus gottheilii]QVY61340.1 penicillin-binding transpeptidase domain-containing protein [Cytobacillus gottheilii]